MLCYHIIAAVEAVVLVDMVELLTVSSDAFANPDYKTKVFVQPRFVHLVLKDSERLFCA